MTGPFKGRFCDDCRGQTFFDAERVQGVVPLHTVAVGPVSGPLRHARVLPRADNRFDFNDLAVYPFSTSWTATTRLDLDGNGSADLDVVTRCRTPSERGAYRNAGGLVCEGTRWVGRGGGVVESVLGRARASGAGRPHRGSSPTLCAADGAHPSTCGLASCSVALGSAITAALPGRAHRSIATIVRTAVTAMRDTIPRSAPFSAGETQFGGFEYSRILALRVQTAPMARGDDDEKHEQIITSGLSLRRI